MLPHPRSPLAGLFAAPGKFDFFQAVRLLERLAASSDRAAVGGDTAPEQEAVHFRVLPALRFPAGPVSKASAEGEGPPEPFVRQGQATPRTDFVKRAEGSAARPKRLAPPEASKYHGRLFTPEEPA